MNKDSSFSKFLQLTNTIGQLPTFPDIDYLEEKLLSICAQYWYADVNLEISELVKKLPQVSERTVYRRIKSLASKKIIELQPDPSDKRVKFVKQTKISGQYFNKLEECFNSVANTGA